MLETSATHILGSTAHGNGYQQKDKKLSQNGQNRERNGKSVKKSKSKSTKSKVKAEAKAETKEILNGPTRVISSGICTFDDNSRSGNDTNADDADIRPIYDEEPMAEVQLTVECNIFAIGQQHTEKPKIIVDGRVNQYPKTCQVKSPMLDSSPDNQITEYSKQSLESENILLKETVAQFQKDFSRMEAHCIALELKYQNQALKSGQHEQTTSLLANNADLKAQIQEKVFAIAALKNENTLREVKRRDKFQSSADGCQNKTWEATIKHLRSLPVSKSNRCYGKTDAQSRGSLLEFCFFLRFQTIWKVIRLSTTSKVDMNPTWFKVDIPYIHECKQTLDVSAGTSINVQKEQSLDLSAEDPRFELETCQGDSLNLPDHRFRTRWLQHHSHSEVGFINQCYSHAFKVISFNIKLVDSKLSPHQESLKVK
ncbi:hypothetical protein Tco_1282385 [Tanacetum coccineum]